jgi:hypothetical protein
LHPIADALVETHKESEAKTKTGLATAAAKAADHVKALDGASTFGQSNKLRDLAASAARIFGSESDKPSVTFNQLVVDAETLGRIRALRDTDNPFKKPMSEGETPIAIRLARRSISLVTARC